MSHVTEEIKSRLDIVVFISDYVQLKPAGANYKGRCPFHNEKTPSFMVSREKQFWHCFGCTTGGDVFAFLMKAENMEFVEALKMLAEKTGVQLTADERYEERKSEKNRLLDAVRLAAKFYHRILLDSSRASEARRYLMEQRGLAEDAIVDWQIGYIPDEWDMLTSFLLKRGIGINDIVKAGLGIQKSGSGGCYDRFRGRIMFPLCDAQGIAVGFTGRLLNENAQNAGGKYVNTPQTPLYDKGRMLFGLHLAKQSIKEQGYAVVVEGQMDVIACHQSGMREVIASSGTALTHDQVRLLKRFANAVRLAFDADLAGVQAAHRGIDIALGEGMDVRVITIPPVIAKDPDECIKKAPDVWNARVSAAQPVMEYYFDIYTRGKDVNNEQDRLHITHDLMQEILKLGDPVHRDYWLEKLSHLLGISVVVLKEQMHRAAEKQPRVRAAFPEKGGAIPVAPETMNHKAGRQLIALFLRYPELLRILKPLLKPEALEQAALREIYERLQEHAQIDNLAGYEGVIHTVRDQLSSEEAAREFMLLEFLSQSDAFEEEDGGGTERMGEYAKELAHRLNMWYTGTQRRALAQEMEKAERAGDAEHMHIISQKLKELL